MQIVPDPLFAALMTLPFVVTTIALHFLLFKPYRAYLVGRDGATVGARHDAETLNAQASDKLDELEAALAAARATAGETRQAARQRGLAHERDVIAKARGEAEKALDAAIAEIGSEADVARGALKDSATALSHEIAGQVLGRAVEA